ncbi:MAG: hypothetical protein KC731_28670, partial [Myxococcales bacterium]|nr:hypothetical protein [Myxococcales bacterium]
AMILREQPRWSRGELRGLLRALCRDGFFESEREIVARCLRVASEARPEPRLDHVAVVTRDRPEQLRGWLQSVCALPRGADRAVTVTVCDDSPDRAARRRLRSMLAALASDSGLRVRYVGLEEKRAFCVALSELEAVPMEVVEAALFDVRGFGRSTGGNRNALSLAHQGQRVLSMDDDTQLRLARTPSSRDVVALDGRSCPLATWFFGQRQDALDGVRFEEVDPMALFGSAFGALPGLLKNGCDVTHASQAMVRRLEAGQGHVVAVSAGVVGDSGVGDPTPWLCLPEGPTRRRLLRARATYEAAFTHKEVVRGATSLAVSDQPFLMAPALALDLGCLLPPFPTTVRNQDGVFGYALRRVMDDGYVAHLPWVVAHLPPSRRYPPCGPGYSLDAMLIGALATATSVGSPAERLEILGAHLCDLAAWSDRRLRAWLERDRQRRIGHRVRLLEERLAEHQERPRRWAADVRRQIEASLEFLVDGPRLPATGPADRALAMCRRVLADYGLVLRWWPRIVAATARLAERGHAMAREP